MTFNKEIYKQMSDNVKIIEEFEASKNESEPVTGH